MSKGVLTVFQTKFDLCDLKNKQIDMLTLTYGIFGIPLSCPFTEHQLFCFKSTKVGSFSKSTIRLLKTFSADGANASVRAFLKHDTGTSCFKVDAQVL